MLSFLAVLVPTLSTVCSVRSDLDLNEFSTGLGGYKVIGAAAHSRLGSNIKAIGDFNGDGLDDMAFNSYGLERIYVVFGRIGNIDSAVDMANFVSSESTGIVILGEIAGDRFGQFLNDAGDVNGDGYDDIVVGSYYASPSGRNLAGKAYVIFGRPNSQVVVDISTATMPATSGYKIIGASGNAHCGRDVSSAGDINGDGFDDVAVGCYEIAMSYIIFGKANNFADIDLAGLSSDSRGFSITGVSSSHFGVALNPAGDFNHDRYDDLFIGAPQGSYLGQTNSGAAYVMFGHTNTTAFPALTAVTDLISGTGGFAIYGAGVDEFCGNAVNFVGDINDDGVDDIAVACFGAPALGRASAGAVYVLFGNPFTTSFPAVDLASFTSSSSRGFRIWGALANDNLGMSFGYAGDMNGDGISDMIISAHGASPFGRSNAGTAYVLFGRRNTTAAFTDLDLASFTTGATTGFRMFGAAASHNMFRCGSSAGDVNGDGLDDLLVGSDNPSEPDRANCGNVFVIYGAGNPTSQPSKQPSSQPTSQPTMDLRFITKMRASPTYRVRNGFAFAVTSANGTVHTWGEAAPGGEASQSVQTQLSSGVASMVPSRSAYTALKTDGSLVPWGVPSHYAGLTPTGPVTNLVATDAAFAAIKADGAVAAFGSYYNGGSVVDNAKCNGFASYLTFGVQALIASSASFTALKADGTVYTWGNKFCGGGVSSLTVPELTGVVQVVATMDSFAARLQSGRVLTWGGKITGGDSSAVAAQLLSGVVHLVASKGVVAAFKQDTSLVVWGHPSYGGAFSTEVTARLSANITFVAHTFMAMAALHADGSVTAWGDAGAGGDASAVQAQLVNVETIVGNGYAFAALTVDGAVVAWGDSDCGGQIPFNKVNSLSSGVVSIHHTDRAFAALKSDWSVVVWGQAGHGGSPGAAVESLLTSGVHTICSNDAAFSAIKTDGSVVGWGHPVSIPTAGVLFHSTSLTVRAECF